MKNMGFDFDGLYNFHGHRCPMSTMGARLALAAMSALGVGKADQFLIEADYGIKNCALDGIQYTTGCTLGNGNISCSGSGKPLLVLWMRDGSRRAEIRVSSVALSKLAAHKEAKAELLKEREISGLARAHEIDGIVERDFLALVRWVQGAPDGELLEISVIGRNE